MSSKTIIHKSNKSGYVPATQNRWPYLSVLASLLIGGATMFVTATPAQAATFSGILNTSNVFSPTNQADTSPLGDGMIYFNAPSAANATFPLSLVTIGEFDFAIPSGDTIVSATISGNFGTFYSNTTAPVNLFLNGIAVGSCAAGSLCTDQAAMSETPWSHTFSGAEFASLASGHAILTAMQLAPSQINLDMTTFSVQTASVPEPSSALLLCLGLLPLIAVARRKATSSHSR